MPGIEPMTFAFSVEWLDLLNDAAPLQFYKQSSLYKNY